MRFWLLTFILFPSLAFSESRPHFIGDEAWDESQSVIVTKYSEGSSNTKNSNFRNGAIFSSSSQKNDQINSSIQFMSARQNNLIQRLSLSKQEAKSATWSQRFSEFSVGLNYEIGKTKLNVDYAKNIENNVYNDRVFLSIEHKVQNFTYLTGYNVVNGQKGSNKSKNSMSSIGLRYESRSKNVDQFAAVYLNEDDWSSQSTQYLNADFRILSKNHSNFIFGVDGRVHKQFDGLKIYGYELGLIGAYLWQNSQFAIKPGFNVTSEHQADNYKVLRADNSFIELIYNQELGRDFYLNASLRLDEQTFKVNDTSDQPLNRASADAKLLSLTITKLIN